MHECIQGTKDLIALATTVYATSPCTQEKWGAFLAASYKDPPPSLPQI